jgi:DNA polymerase-3 subunit beta
MATATRKAKTGGITLPASTLRAALAAVGPAVPSRSPKPILQNIRLGDGLITGTDLEVRIDAAIDYHGDAILLPYQRLAAILSASSGDEVTLSPDGTRCVVRCGSGTWTLPTEDAAEFPIWEPTDAKPVTRLPADQLCRAIKGVGYAVDGESSRYALGAVLLEVDGPAVTLVATDGRRLSIADMTHDVAVDDRRQPKKPGEAVLPPLLIPSRVAGIVSKLAHAAGDEGVQIDATSSEVIVEIGTTTVTGRLVDGRFPPWRDAVPEHGLDPTTVTVEQLLAATRAAAVVTSEQSKGVDYTFTADGIHLHGQSSEAGESSVTCEIVEAGNACTVKLDPLYVREWLAGLPADGEPTVSIQAKDHASAVVMKTDTFTGVIMPLAKD